MPPAKDDAKAWRKEALRLRKQLEDLTLATCDALYFLDVIMKEPSSVARGRRVAAVLNALEMANDGARHFGLGISFKSKRWNGDKTRASSASPPTAPSERPPRT